MSIKPVLVPDQDAATLRKLMDRFAEATTGPTRQELTESRAAVAAAQGVAEGLDPTTDSARDARGNHRGEVKKTKDGSYVATNQAGSRKIFTSEKAAKAHANSSKEGVAENDMSALAGFAAGTVGGIAVPLAVGSLAFAVRDALDSTDALATRKARVDTAEIFALQRQIVSIHKMLGRVKTDATKEKYQDMLKQAYAVLDELKARQGNRVAEARPDVMRHAGDTTIRVVKKGGVPIGEIGIDSEASPGNGAYYVKLYDGSYDAVGFDTAEEALAELKAAVKQMREEGVTEAAIAEDSIRPNLAAALKQLGFKGPFKLGQLPKWMAELEPGLFGEDTSIMIGGDDPEYDPWVAKGYDYGYAYGIETGYQTGLSAREVLNNAKSDIQNIKSMAESAASEFKPGDRVQFTSPRGAVEDGVVVKDLYPGAVEVKFDSGETRGVYATSLKPLPAAVAESIDPVAQLRADILRFSM